MGKGVGRRERRGERAWIEILRRFESSGLGVGSFCHHEGLSPSTLQRWRARLGAQSAKRFVELVPAVAADRERGEWSLELALPNGVTLRWRG